MHLCRQALLSKSHSIPNASSYDQPSNSYANGGIGYRLSDRKFVELTYRALGVDYDSDGFLYDVITHGPEVSIGMIF